MPIITVARYIINQEVADLGLAFVHFIRGCDGEGHGPCARGWADGYRADGCRPVGAHQAGVETYAWSCEQDLCGEVPAFRIDSIS